MEGIDFEESKYDEEKSYGFKTLKSLKKVPKWIEDLKIR